MSCYYMKSKGKLYGPFTIEQIMKCTAREIFKNEDMISEDQMNWIRLEEFKQTRNSRNMSAGETAPRISAKTARPPMPIPSVAEAAKPSPKNGSVYSPELLLSLSRSKMKLKVFGVLLMVLFFLQFVINGIFVIGGVGKTFVAMAILGIFSVLLFFCLLTDQILGYIGLYRSWCSILPEDSEITPGKAVGFLFIPVFNLFWIFPAFYGLSKAINLRAERNGISQRPSSQGAILTFCILILLSSLMGVILTTLGALFYWSHNATGTNICSILFWLFCILDILFLELTLYCLVSSACRLVENSGIRSAPANRMTAGALTVHYLPEGYVPKKRITYILLGIFLGGFGIHNFYAGYTTNAIVQLLITLLTGCGGFFVLIWVIVELCTVTHDANGIQME